MEFRETLLQNEIHHLGNNFRLLSAELLLIQDFIKEEFGSKFLAFCNVRREQQRPSYSQSSTKNSIGPRKSRTMGGTGTYYGQTMIEEECEEMFGVAEEPCIIPDGQECSGSEGEEGSEEEYDPMGVVEFEMDDSNFEAEAKHNPNILSLSEKVLSGSETEVTGKGGRRKSIIHRYFEKVQAADGKLKHKCQTCGNFVSSQAQRLKKHLIKCRGKDSNVMQILDKLQVAKYKTATFDNKPGRKTDVVRLAFEGVKDPSGYNKMKCLNCGELVSNQPSRMRNHLSRCTGESQKFPHIDIGVRKLVDGFDPPAETQKQNKSDYNNFESRPTEKPQTSSAVSLLPDPPVFVPSSSSAPLPTPQGSPLTREPEEAFNIPPRPQPRPHLLPSPPPPPQSRSQQAIERPQYPNSSRGHGWSPVPADADVRESFRLAPFPSYLIPPPPDSGSRYEQQ